MSANVIRCPKCGIEVDEAHATYGPTGQPHFFRVTHTGACGHTWEAHHRMFYRQGGQPRFRSQNPFEPVRLVL